MKTVTCSQLGGPCETAHRGGSADDVIKAQDAHLRERIAGGDGTHAEADEAMRGRWKHPISGMKWYRETKKTFASLPED